MNNENEAETEKKAGYLVLRLKQGDGIIISDTVEIRICEQRNKKETAIAIRAPKDIHIKRIKNK